MRFAGSSLFKFLIILLQLILFLLLLLFLPMLTLNETLGPPDFFLSEPLSEPELFFFFSTGAITKDCYIMGTG